LRERSNFCTKNNTDFYIRQQKAIGKNFFSNELVNEILKSRSESICICGIQHFHDYLHLKLNFKEITLVLVTSRFLQRWKRNRSRKRIKNISFFKFLFANIFTSNNELVHYAKQNYTLKIKNNKSKPVLEKEISKKIIQYKNEPPTLYKRNAD